VILGKNGIEKILELELQPETRKRLEKSAATIKEAINKLPEN
jgi:malate/lactate dehydrogenase